MKFSDGIGGHTQPPFPILPARGRVKLGSLGLIVLNVVIVKPFEVPRGHREVALAFGKRWLHPCRGLGLGAENQNKEQCSCKSHSRSQPLRVNAPQPRLFRICMTARSASEEARSIARFPLGSASGCHRSRSATGEQVIIRYTFFFSKSLNRFQASSRAFLVAFRTLRVFAGTHKAVAACFVDDWFKSLIVLLHQLLRLGDCLIHTGIVTGVETVHRCLDLGDILSLDRAGTIERAG